jgi:AraC-like DNA-binding protein
MPLLLDTNDVPAADRAERYRDVLSRTANADLVDIDVRRGSPEARLRFNHLGRSALFTNASSATRLAGSVRHASRTDDTVVSLAVQLQGTQLQRSATGESTMRPGDLVVIDHTHGYDVRWTGLTTVAAFKAPREVLGLTVDEIHRAATQLTSSALYPLVRRHLAELARLPEELMQGDVGTQIGEATLSLTRALLLDAKDPGASGPGPDGATLMTQVRVYVDQHLGDPDLGAEQVAAALSVSRRTLYRLFARQGLRLEQYIISERLQAARSALETADPTVPIARIAHQSGFKDAQHFSRRFKQQFGMAPQDFRTALAR